MTNKYPSEELEQEWYDEWEGLTINDNYSESLERFMILKACDWQRGRSAGCALMKQIVPDPERIAQLIAHRACCSSEHDLSVGKLHSYCVVCGVPWPCEYAGTPPRAPTGEEAK